MLPRHVRKIRDVSAKTPAAANLRIKALQAMFSWAVKAEEIPHNPTLGVKKMSYVSRGFATATSDEI